MKRVLVTGLTLALLTGGVFAQAAAPAGAPPATAGMKAPPPPASGGPDAMTDDAGGPPPPPHGGPGGPGGHRPPPPSKAAHFHLEHGDTALDVKCADDEPMTVCADLTLQMLERLQAMPAAPKP